MSNKSEVTQTNFILFDDIKSTPNLIQDKIFRCPICMQIPRISIIGILKNSMIIYTCKCGKNEIPINLFLKEFTENQILFSNCSYIKHNEIIKKKKNINDNNNNNLIFCFECKKCYCESCLLIHNLENSNINHRKIQIELLDTHCPCNKNPAQGFCLFDNENVCYECRNNHLNHQIIQPFDFNLTNLEIETFKKDFIEVFNLINEKNRNYKDEIVKILKQKISEIEKAYNESLDINNKILKIFSNYYLMKNAYSSYFVYPILSTLKNIKFNNEKNPLIKDSSDITKIVKEGILFFKNYSVIDFNKTSSNLEELTSKRNESIDNKILKKLSKRISVNNSANIANYKKYPFLNNKNNNNIIRNNNDLLTLEKTSSNNSFENATKYSSFGTKKKYSIKNNKEKSKSKSKEKDEMNFSNTKFKRGQSIYSAYNNHRPGISPRKKLPLINNENKKSNNYLKNSKEFNLKKFAVHEEKNRYNEFSQVEFVFKKN